MKLSLDQIKQFNEKGYLVIENLVDSQTIDAIRAEYSTLVDGLYDEWFAKKLVDLPAADLDFWGKLDQGYLNDLDVHQPLNLCLPHGNVKPDSPFHIGPAVFDLMRHPSILDAVEGLIGPEITTNPIQHVRIKPPQRAVRQDELRAHVIATDWHQDKGVTLAEADQTDFVTVWLAITDATIENGCLQVANTGPTDALLPHCLNKQVSIIDKHIPSAGAIPTPVKSGGAVLFHPLTPHSSLTNKSDHYRWSFDLRYNVTGQPTGRSHFPEFIARSQRNPDDVFDDWRQWKSMWEDTRSRLSQGPYQAQHRWDISNPYCA